MCACVCVGIGRGGGTYNVITTKFTLGPTGFLSIDYPSSSPCRYKISLKCQDVSDGACYLNLTLFITITSIPNLHILEMVIQWDLRKFHR